MFAKLIILGNLGSDPEMRYTPAGKPFTRISLAVNRTWANDKGEKQVDTTWFRVMVWGMTGRARVIPNSGRAHAQPRPRRATNT